MSSSRINRNQKFLGLQLGLGLLWRLVMPWLPSARGATQPSEVEISTMLLLSLTLYLPLFFTLVVWFWPFALLPRGLLTAGLLRFR